jgi:hypothetical protein
LAVRLSRLFVRYGSGFIAVNNRSPVDIQAGGKRQAAGQADTTQCARELGRNTICARASTDADAQAHRSDWSGQRGALHSHECESFPELIGDVGRSAIVATPRGWTTRSEANVERSGRRYSIRAGIGSTFVHKKYHTKLWNMTRLSSVKTLKGSTYDLISLSTSLFRQFIAIQTLLLLAQFGPAHRSKR